MGIIFGGRKQRARGGGYFRGRLGNRGSIYYIFPLYLCIYLWSDIFGNNIFTRNLILSAPMELPFPNIFSSFLPYFVTDIRYTQIEILDKGHQIQKKRNLKTQSDIRQRTLGIEKDIIYRDIRQKTQRTLDMYRDISQRIQRNLKIQSYFRQRQKESDYFLRKK